MLNTFEELYLTAHKAGLQALLAVAPTPLVAVERANPFDGNSAIVAADYVTGGLCGFAWVVVKPASSEFARWLLKNELANRHEGGRTVIWIREGGQSIECKQLYAQAFAEVLKANGINARPYSRLD